MLASPQIAILLRDIKDNPGDDTPRLVLADWLQEFGTTDAERARGEFLYLQCLFERLGEADPRWGPTRHRLSHLRGEYELDWVGPWLMWAEWWAFRRGLLRPSLTGLRRLGDRGLAEETAWAWVDRLRVFPLPDSDVPRLTRSPCLGELNRLDLSGNRRDAGLARALAECPHLARLTHLDLSGNALGDDGARALAGSARFPCLTHLSLRSNRIGNRGAWELARSPHLRGVRRLDLRWNDDISAPARKALVERFEDPFGTKGEG